MGAGVMTVMPGETIVVQTLVRAAQRVQSTIRAVDTEVRKVSMTAGRVDIPIRCIASWQQIAP